MISKIIFRCRRRHHRHTSPTKPTQNGQLKRSRLKEHDEVLPFKRSRLNKSENGFDENGVGSMSFLEFAKFEDGLGSMIAFQHLKTIGAKEPIVLAAQDLRLLCESAVSIQLLPLFVRLGGRFIHNCSDIGPQLKCVHKTDGKIAFDNKSQTFECPHLQRENPTYTLPESNNLFQSLHIDLLMSVATAYSRSIFQEVIVLFPNVLSRIIVQFVSPTEWHKFFLHPSSPVPTHLSTPHDSFTIPPTSVPCDKR